MTSPTPLHISIVSKRRTTADSTRGSSATMNPRIASTIGDTIKTNHESLDKSITAITYTLTGGKLYFFKLI